MTEGGKGKTKVAAGYGQTAVKRSYGYDRTGNLTHSTDQRTGTTRFEYDKLGRITKAGNELFAFDPAHNILSDGLNAVPDNRLKTYNGTSYYYDELGNLIHRELADGEVQNYFYDLYDQLVKAEIFKKDGTKETWAYSYDALGRRIGKGRLKTDGSLEEETRFVWDGSHLLQETHPDGRYTYIYADQDSYKPLAQVRNRTNREGESKQEINYFHKITLDDEGAKILDSVTNIEDVDGKETACPGGVLVKSNEQGAKGIGRNLIDKLNAHIVKIETGMRRR